MAGRLVPLTAAMIVAGGAAGAQDPEVDRLSAQVREWVEAGDLDRVREAMAAGGNAEAVGARYQELVRSLYHSAKALPAVVRLARMGIDDQLAEARVAEERGDRERAALLRGGAKRLAYDLASYTWPGWDEPGIRIRTADLEAGYEAARLNLELALELERGPEPMANAHFILGGHALAAGDDDAAEEHFGRFGQIARSAGLVDLAIVADGYGVIAGAAAGSGNPGTYMLEPVRERLREAVDAGADFWIDQLDTAWRIFVTG